MIFIKDFAKRRNLGNQLYALASLIGMSERYGCDFMLPQWRYYDYFSTIFQVGKPDKIDIHLTEPHFGYCPEYFDMFARDMRKLTVNINGYLQSYKYWQNCEDWVKASLRFGAAFEYNIKADMPDKPLIAVSVRRGDFVGSKVHYLLPVEYYKTALAYFDNIRHHYEVMIFSDDMPWCRDNFGDGYYYSDGNDIEQLCQMTMCQHFVIANSTFSWMGAYLGQKPDSVVIRPERHFVDAANMSDHYPVRWKIM